MQKNHGGFPPGVKKTRQRERVFSVLEQAETPLSAQEIFLRAQAEDASLWLSTVYRILDFFASKGLITKATVMDGKQALYALAPLRHQHYAVCLGCRKVVALVNCPMEAFEPELDEGGFRVLGHKVEMYGYCRDCEHGTGTPK